MGLPRAGPRPTGGPVLIPRTEVKGTTGGCRRNWQKPAPCTRVRGRFTMNEAQRKITVMGTVGEEMGDDNNKITLGARGCELERHLWS